MIGKGVDIMDNNKIGAFLQALRKAKGKTQQDIADYFYVSPKSVSKWECGAAIPEIGMLVSLAEYYDVTVDEILKGEKNSAGKTVTEDTEKRNNKEREKYFVNKRKDKVIMFVLLSFTITIVGYFLLFAVGYTSFYGKLAGSLSLLFSFIAIVVCLFSLHTKNYQYEELISKDNIKELKQFQFNREYLFYCFTFTIVISALIFTILSGSVNLVLSFSSFASYTLLMLLWEIPLYYFIYLLILKFKFNDAEKACFFLNAGSKILATVSVVGAAIAVLISPIAEPIFSDHPDGLYMYSVFDFGDSFWYILFFAMLSFIVLAVIFLILFIVNKKKLYSVHIFTFLALFISLYAQREGGSVAFETGYYESVDSPALVALCGLFIAYLVIDVIFLFVNKNIQKKKNNSSI